MRVRFGDCVLDSETRQLTVGGEAVHLSPKAFRFLELLLERRPKALSKSEIHERLWPGTFVSDSALTSLLVEVRSATGDSARESRFVRTVHGFGYAFRARAVPERGGEAAEPGAGGLVYRLVWGRREITLDRGDNLIGRDREAVVWIDDESVSRRHARISIGDGGAMIQDLDSKNGTYVRGKKLRGPGPLADRDVVAIGPAKLTLRVMSRTGSTRSRKKGSTT